MAIDHKPKTTRSLERLANIARNATVSLLIDHYDDGDWTQLWWIRFDGEATVHADGPVFEGAISRLVAKYEQYREHRPEGPAIVVDVRHRTGWAAAEFD